jgi:tetratricopeptide (TPR) repeat protein
MKLSRYTFLLILLPLFTQASSSTPVEELQHGWAVANYQLEDKAQIQAFEQLIVKAEKLTSQQPKSADLWIWSGIIKSTYAGVKGGLGALSYAKAARKDLEYSLTLDDQAMKGSAYTSLGTLYFNLPGWPISFGDDEKAENLLKKALLINPDGIDNNYFYAEYLRENSDYKKSEAYLIKASNAAARPKRPLADQGRQMEIQAALKDVRENIGTDN